MPKIIGTKNEEFLKYLDENPYATIKELSEKFDLVNPRAYIGRFKKDGYLTGNNETGYILLYNPYTKKINDFIEMKVERGRKNRKYTIKEIEFLKSFQGKKNRNQLMKLFNDKFEPISYIQMKYLLVKFKIPYKKILKYKKDVIGLLEVENILNKLIVRVKELKNIQLKGRKRN